MDRKSPQFGAEVLKAIEQNKKLATIGQEAAIENGWINYDSSIENLEKTFITVLPNYTEGEINAEKPGEMLRTDIEETLSGGKKAEKLELTGAEFGGPGSNFFINGLTKGFLKRTIGICLRDIRDENEQERDKKNNHSIIAPGDILDVQSDKLLFEITQELGTNKINLIMCRLQAAVIGINKNPAILDRVIRNWYKMLNENGLMFIQFRLGKDPVVQSIVEKWSAAIKEKFPEEIDIRIGNSANNGVMRLHKKPGAPEELPPATQLFAKAA